MNGFGKGEISFTLAELFLCNMCLLWVENIHDGWSQGRCQFFTSPTSYFNLTGIYIMLLSERRKRKKNLAKIPFPSTALEHTQTPRTWRFTHTHTGICKYFPFKRYFKMKFQHWWKTPWWSFKSAEWQKFFRLFHDNKLNPYSIIIFANSKFITETEIAWLLCPRTVHACG